MAVSLNLDLSGTISFNISSFGEMQKEFKGMVGLLPYSPGHSPPKVLKNLALGCTPWVDGATVSTKVFFGWNGPDNQG